MKKEDAKWWALFGGGTAALIATDRRTSRALPNTASQISFSKNLSRIGADYTTLPVAAGLYLYGRWKDNPKARETGVLGAEALLDSYMIVIALKVASGRERPEFGEGKGRFFKGHRGFPSGHAIMSWSFASLIAHEYAPSKVTPIIAYSLASVASVSRFSARKHFASDIVAGGAMGWFIGKYVFERHLDPAIHKRYDPNARTRFMPDVNPMFQPSTHTYGVNLAWNKN
jgi:membrane-associated phospholipid phosphatase